MSTRSVLKRRALLIGAAATAALALSACDSTTAPTATAPAPASPTTGDTAPGTATDTDHNGADATFAQMMIAHHRQAIDMASLVDARASRADVKALAATIKQAQQPEIDTMNQWLIAWGATAPMPSMTGPMNHGTMPAPMPGGMPPAAMAGLAKVKGATFDTTFLTMMITHHQGALTMANQELKAGRNPAAKALAQQIITNQQAQITQMQAMLKKS